MKKIRNYGVMAIVLPSLCKQNQSIIHPIEAGDRLQLAFMERLIKQFHATWPSAFFTHKRISILSQGSETLLTSFSLPAQVSIPSRLHVAIISNAASLHLKCFLASGKQIALQPLPFSTDAQWLPLFASNTVPHIVLIEPSGQISSITQGIYLTGSNICSIANAVDPHLFEKAGHLLSSTPASH